MAGASGSCARQQRKARTGSVLGAGLQRLAPLTHFPCRPTATCCAELRATVSSDAASMPCARAARAAAASTTPGSGASGSVCVPAVPAAPAPAAPAAVPLGARRVPACAVVEAPAASVVVVWPPPPARAARGLWADAMAPCSVLGDVVVGGVPKRSRGSARARAKQMCEGSTTCRRKGTCARSLGAARTGREARARARTWHVALLGRCRRQRHPPMPLELSTTWLSVKCKGGGGFARFRVRCGSSSPAWLSRSLWMDFWACGVLRWRSACRRRVALAHERGLHAHAGEGCCCAAMRCPNGPGSSCWGDVRPWHPHAMCARAPCGGQRALSESAGGSAATASHLGPQAT